MTDFARLTARSLPLTAVFLAAALSACTSTSTDLSTSNLPPMQWDEARPVEEAREWTATTLEAVETHDEALALAVPQDVAEWCPGYTKASLEDRRAFWVGLMSATARYESSWNPEASGGGGRWIGVMQISPRSASYHGCEADTASELTDGADNLTCAATMMASAVERDGLVVGAGNRGIGRDWAPFRDAAKRQAMSEWTRAQPYCNA